MSVSGWLRGVSAIDPRTQPGVVYAGALFVALLVVMAGGAHVLAPLVTSRWCHHRGARRFPAGLWEAGA